MKGAKERSGKDETGGNVFPKMVFAPQWPPRIGASLNVSDHSPIYRAYRLDAYAARGFFRRIIMAPDTLNDPADRMHRGCAPCSA
jgi:hypothetical protein